MLFGMQELGMKNSFFCDLIISLNILYYVCLLYTSDAADEL